MTMNRVYKVIYSRIRHCYVVVSELAHRQRKEKSAHASILPAAAAAALIFQLGLGGSAMAAVVPSGPVPTNSNNASASGAVNIEKNSDGSLAQGSDAYTTYDSEGNLISGKDNEVVKITTDPNADYTRLDDAPGNVALGTRNSIGKFTHADDNLTPVSGNNSYNYQNVDSTWVSTKVYNPATGTYEDKQIKVHSLVPGQYMDDEHNVRAKEPQRSDYNNDADYQAAHKAYEDVAPYYNNDKTSKSYYTSGATAVGTDNIAEGSRSTAIGNNARVLSTPASFYIDKDGKLTWDQDSAYYFLDEDGHVTTTPQYAKNPDGSYYRDPDGHLVKTSFMTVSRMTDSTDAVAVGSEVQAEGRSAVAVGHNSHSEEYGVAIGDKSNTGYMGVAIGHENDAQYSSVAVGHDNHAPGYYETVAGSYNTANGNYSSAIGYDNDVTGTPNSSGSTKAQKSHAYGADNTVTGDYNLAAGNGNKITGNYDIALGNNSTASGTNASAIGQSAQATASDALALGSNASSSASNATAPGSSASASGEYATASGYNAHASGSKATALGYNAYASYDDSLAAGSSAKAYAKNAVALGNSAYASLDGAVALGSNSVASRASGTVGYDPLTGTSSALSSGIWKATDSAISIGNGTSVTRQLTGLAAGSADTDAVNVAQLKNAVSAISFDYSIFNGGSLSGGSYSTSGRNEIASYTTAGSLKLDFGDGIKATLTDGNVVHVGLDADYIHSDPLLKGEKGDKGDQGQIGMTGAPGIRGEKGDKGDKGDTGAQGPAGPEGPQGIPGLPGFTGPRGQDGFSPVANVSTDATTGETTITITDKSGTTTTTIPSGAGKAATQEITEKVENINNQVTNMGNTISNLKTDVRADRQYEGDDSANGKVNVQFGKALRLTGGANLDSLSGEGNIGVVQKVGDDGLSGLSVQLSRNLKGMNSTTYTTMQDGQPNTTVINGKGLTVSGQDGQSAHDIIIQQGNISMGGQAIHHVAAGTADDDAVNVSQLKSLSSSVASVNNRVNRVGAGAAALASLHPLDFDPDEKWNFAAGYGNYRGANATAIGAFYRPNEDVLLSAGGSFGGGENMVNAGISFRIGQGSHVTNSRVAMAKEILALKDCLKKQEQQIQELQALVGKKTPESQEPCSLLFPDVPKNHWAYAYVKDLAEKGLLEGFPDGEFKGNRTFTRYEFAAIFSRALANGAIADSSMQRMSEEFAPEIKELSLDRFRVDRVSGDENSRDKIERVRVNSEDEVIQKHGKDISIYRDHYGSRIEK